MDFVRIKELLTWLGHSITWADDYASLPREENGRPTKVADLDSEIRKHPILETNDRLNTNPISCF